MVPCTCDVFLFNVAGAGHNPWLRLPVLLIEVTQLLRNFVAVHHRHANVGDNEAVGVRASLQGVLGLGEALEAVIGAVNQTGESPNLEATD